MAAWHRQRWASAALGIDARAMAAPMIGSLVNVKMVEALEGQRLLAAWAHLYRLVVDDAS